jgi:hypothetical protein
LAKLARSCAASRAWRASLSACFTVLASRMVPGILGFPQLVPSPLSSLASGASWTSLRASRLRDKVMPAFRNSGPEPFGALRLTLIVATHARGREPNSSQRVPMTIKALMQRKEQMQRP